MMNKCPKCKTEGEFRFCPNCGTEMALIVENNEPEIIENAEKLSVQENIVLEEKNGFWKTKTGKRLIALVLILAIVGGIYYFVDKNKKEELEAKAVEVAQEFGFNNAFAVVKGKEQGIYTGTVYLDEFEKLSYDEMFKMDDSMPIGAIFEYVDMSDDFAEYNVYPSTNSIYKNNKEIYDDYFNSEVAKSIEDRNDDESSSSTSAVSTGEKNALQSAESYLRLGTGMSEKGLRDQLDYEGFTSSEIDYALEHCNADWEEQCEYSARSYMKSSSLSKSGLIGQLEYEGFSHDLASRIVDELY